MTQAIGGRICFRLIIWKPVLRCRQGGLTLLLEVKVITKGMHQFLFNLHLQYRINSDDGQCALHGHDLSS